MLVLARRVGQKIRIGDDIVLTIMDFQTYKGSKVNKVRIGIEAPREVSVFRQELYDHIQAQKKGSGTDASNNQTEPIRVSDPKAEPERSAI